MRIINLSSGSKANATFIEFEDTKILIDAGLNEKKLALELGEIGQSLKDIKAIFITHEHVDHIRGIKAIAKKYDTEFFMHKKLFESGYFSDVNFKEGKVHTFEYDLINFENLQIKPFEISHDAVAPVGFVVNVFGSKSRAGFVTDLGIVTETVKRELFGVKMVFIESNYDEQMLLGGKYPYLVKQRIAGKFGHLSNAQSLELSKFLFESGTKCFVLSHISENNNDYSLCYSNYVDYFEKNNISLNKDVFIRVSFQEKRGKNFNLKEEYDGK